MPITPNNYSTNQPFVVPIHSLFYRGPSCLDAYTPLSGLVNPEKKRPPQFRILISVQPPSRPKPAPTAAPRGIPFPENNSLESGSSQLRTSFRVSRGLRVPQT